MRNRKSASHWNETKVVGALHYSNWTFFNAAYNLNIVNFVFVIVNEIQAGSAVW